jgi:sugar/nucleoside kinase (ribokinase family)
LSSNTVIAVGSITRDRIHTHRRLVEQIGGAVWHAGRTFAQLGMQTRVVTGFAAKEDTVLGDALRNAGVEVLRTPSAATSVFVNDYTVIGADDRTQEVLTLADPIGVYGLTRGLKECDLVYLGPLHPDDISERTLAAILEKKSFQIALDVQGYTRRIEHGHVEAKVDDGLFALLPGCDVIKANQSEAYLLTGSADPSQAVRHLRTSHEHSESVVTCGSEGVYVAAHDAVHFQAVTQVETDDPTGAGDIFFAAYLTRRIQGEPVTPAAQFAADFTARRLQDPTRRVLLTDRRPG